MKSKERRRDYPMRRKNKHKCQNNLVMSTYFSSSFLLPLADFSISYKLVFTNEKIEGEQKEVFYVLFIFWI